MMDYPCKFTKFCTYLWKLINVASGEFRFPRHLFIVRKRKYLTASKVLIEYDGRFRSSHLAQCQSSSYWLGAESVKLSAKTDSNMHEVCGVETKIHSETKLLYARE